MPLQLPATPPPAANAILWNRGQILVRTKKTWGDSWEDFDYVEALQVVQNAAPGISTASFVWKSGKLVKFEDQANYVDAGGPKQLQSQFVAVYASPGYNPSILSPKTLSPGQTLLFMGRFQDDDKEIFSGSPGLGSPTDQTLAAYGFEAELDRQPIESAWCINGLGTAFEIGHPLTFNERFNQGLTDGGNRSAEESSIDGSQPSRKSYTLAGKSAAATPSPWSAFDIIKYVVMRFSPVWMPIELGGAPSSGGSTVWDALDKVVIQYSPAGKSIKRVLDELIGRQRGMGWWLNPTTDKDGNTIFRIEVFTLVGEDVKVDDAILPANKPQQKLNVYSILNRDVKVVSDVLAKYSKIRVVGERLRVAFTAGFADSTLEKGWTDAEEAAYKSVDGANAAAKDRNRESAEYSHVWTTFQIPKAWGWQAGDGAGGEKNPVNPLINTPDGKLSYGSGVSPSRDWGHRLLRTLPLRKLQLKTDTEAEYMEPFAAITVKDPTTHNDLWKFLHRMGSSFQSCHVRPLDTELGIEVSISPNHLLALDSWTWSSSDSAAKTSEAYDYRKIAATVAVQTDQRLMVEVVIDPNDTEGKIKVIEVPDAEMWLVVPGTIVDIQDDKPVRWNEQEHAKQVSSGAASTAKYPLVRDDSARLRQIAALAKAWYGVERSQMQLTVDIFDVVLSLGTYVSHIIQNPPDDAHAGGQGYPVNTVITQIVYDVRACTTKIATNHSELDVTSRNREPMEWSHHA